MEVFGGFSDEDDDPGWLTPDEGVLPDRPSAPKNSHPPEVAVGSGHLGVFVEDLDEVQELEEV